ncbi:MAG: hypothetical protein DRJ03_09225 [Chloroflexi bacterium]|nr:MAG: hypothetical protein DRI81_04735 [Chloroflexota bacterium]RLC86287.1 MAG: hypothetical protein DRJ03_09225 [Chloroflexota bacterium]
MTISTGLQFAPIDELYLDPMNPRLGRSNIGREITQEKVLESMRTWTLEELALSYLENGGFWTHEALLVVEEEELDGSPRLVVVEGNRRLAALKYLHAAYEGRPVSKKWETMSESAEPLPTLFTRVPYILVDSRKDVQAFLGFRHVTGIKQWGADEKAGFIAKLIDEQGLTYEQVMRKIGSKTPTVRKHYIAYRLLLQIEDSVESFDPELADGRFAVLYMSVQTEGVRQYLQIDIMADLQTAKRPVPDDHLENLARFARWLFGTKDMHPLVTDTRQVSGFGKILESEEAVQYLKRTTNPNFEVAFRIAGGDESEIVRYIEEAADNIEMALSRAHLYKGSSELKNAVRRLGADALQLLKVFPEIRQDLVAEEV